VEAKGYIRRSESSTNRRTIRFSLTLERFSIVTELAPRARQIIRAFVTGVSGSDLEITLSMLQRIYFNLIDNCEGALPVNRKLTITRRVRRRVSGVSAASEPF
jgi:hypothetical protein